jgi:hypothetical protein
MAQHHQAKGKVKAKASFQTDEAVNNGPPWWHTPTLNEIMTGTFPAHRPEDLIDVTTTPEMHTLDRPKTTYYLELLDAGVLKEKKSSGIKR